MGILRRSFKKAVALATGDEDDLARSKRSALGDGGHKKLKKYDEDLAQDLAEKFRYMDATLVRKIRDGKMVH